MGLCTQQRSCGRQTKEAAQQSPGMKVLERLEVPHPHQGPQRDGALPVVWTAQPIGRRLCCIGSESLGSERPGFASGLCPDDSQYDAVAYDRDSVETAEWDGNPGMEDLNTRDAH